MKRLIAECIDYRYSVTCKGVKCGVMGYNIENERVMYVYPLDGIYAGNVFDVTTEAFTVREMTELEECLLPTPSYITDRKYYEKLLRK